MSKWWATIDKDLNWRKAELAELRLKVTQEAPAKVTEPQSLAYKVLLRAAWGMLYAHYEGFCLSTLYLYLDELEKLKVPRGQCRENLLLFSLEKHLPKARILPLKEIVQFIQNDFAALLSADVDFPRHKKYKDAFAIKGRSNLWPSDLAECCNTCCITCSAVDATDLRLKLLVGRRNAIAHGKDTPVRDHHEYVDYENHVYGVMDALAKAVDDALGNCLYMVPDIKRQRTAGLAFGLAQVGHPGGPDAHWYEAERQLSEGKR